MTYEEIMNERARLLRESHDWWERAYEANRQQGKVEKRRSILFWLFPHRREHRIREYDVQISDAIVKARQLEQQAQELSGLTMWGHIPADPSLGLPLGSRQPLWARQLPSVPSEQKEETCDCIPDKFSSRSCPKCGRKAVA